MCPLLLENPNWAHGRVCAAELHWDRKIEKAQGMCTGQCFTKGYQRTCHLQQNTRNDTHASIGVSLNRPQEPLVSHKKPTGLIKPTGERHNSGHRLKSRRGKIAKKNADV